MGQMAIKVEAKSIKKVQKTFKNKKTTKKIYFFTTLSKAKEAEEILEIEMSKCESNKILFMSFLFVTRKRDL